MLRRLRHLNLAKYKGQEVTLVEPAMVIKRTGAEPEFVKVKELVLSPDELYKLIRNKGVV